MTRWISRREAILEALAGAGAVALGGCGGVSPPRTGSTLHSTWFDPDGNGQLRPGRGEPLIDRLELAPRSAPVDVLATLAHVTDAHVLDASSPARVTFLDRLGAPFQSTFRPQEALTVQVLAGAVAAVRELRPDAVIQGGDLIDNDQLNELRQALAVLRGGSVHPGSGPHGYFGVQSTFNPDPFYYRPDIDAPRHAGLLQAAVHPVRSVGVGAPTYPVLGDHDVLVAGEIVPTDLTRALAVGDRALWELPSGLTLPSGARAAAALSPDGPPAPALVNGFLRKALAGPTVTVPADPARRELAVLEVVSRLRSAAGSGIAETAGGRLDYTLDVGPRVRLIVLDLARRGGGSGGLVSADQPARLARALDAARDRWVIVVTHQPLQSSVGGDRLLELLDSSPRVVAVLSGHTHRNRVTPRPSGAGGYWLISTASLIDYPQQARALRLLATASGGVAIQTWMLDHTVPGQLGTIARQLSYLDAQGGRPNHFAGTRLDRNLTLYR
jgi:3',5'-cyclic AMP phosphodiesterase CpdA